MDQAPDPGVPSILLADDDTEVLDLLRERLSLKGFVVLTATNGIEACLQVARWRPRAVIIDLFVPGLGGIGTLNRIRAVSPEVIVVLISDVPGAVDLVVAAGLNVAAAFSKPVDPDEVAAALARVGVTASVEAQPGAGEDRPRPLRVMIVDDEPRFREVLAEYLNGRGITAMAVPSGEKALEAAPEFGPHIVLLDLLMPGIGGMETLRRLRASHPSVRVVMVTAIEDLNTARKTLSAGAVDYLTKPFPLDYLNSVLAVHAPLGDGEPAAAPAPDGPR
jgi:DNA-binding response OmpR family regulator